jgi:3-oxoadipate enol-lactonase
MPFAEITDGALLHYRFDGPAEAPRTVMLCNSLASNLDMWNRQVPALIDAGFRVLRYDTRGHGQSSAPPGAYSVETLALDAVRLLDHLGLAKIDFCGLSLGGMTGQMLGARHASRLNTLTLCATAAFMSPPGLWDQRIEAVRDGGMSGVADASLERWFTPNGRVRMAAEIDAIRGGILSTSVAGFCSCCAAIRDMDQRESIKVIGLPTLVIAGKDDPSTTVDAAEFIHAQIADSRLVIINDAQHFVNVEQAEPFNKALLEFLQAGE